MEAKLNLAKFVMLCLATAPHLYLVVLLMFRTIIKMLRGRLSRENKLIVFVACKATTDYTFNGANW